MNYETWLQSDISQPLKIVTLPGVFFTGDKAANLIGVEIFNKGNPVSLSGGCLGYYIRPDGATLPITGTISGNKASIVLPDSAYVLEGFVDITIKVSQNNTTTTVASCRGYVHRTTTETIIDPGHAVPDLEELLSQISAMQSATQAANQATTNANDAADNANAKAALADEKAAATDAAATAANAAATNANNKASLANTAANSANTAATNANDKAALANTAAEAASTAATNANNKADIANTAASNADSKASLADTAAETANAAASNANDKASLADAAATNANNKADIANTAAEAADTAAANTPTQTTSETTYQVSDSGDSVPSGTWQSTIPNVPQGAWLWAKTILTWNNGDVSDPIYMKAYNGVNGGGVIYISDTQDENGGMVRTITAASLEGDTVTADVLQRGYTAHDANGNPIVGTRD